MPVVNFNSEKNVEEYQINDTLRKKQERLLLKSNKDAYDTHMTSTMSGDRV